ncbi:MAG: glycosyltransferase [Sphingobacteriaceae bacterium]|nr:MAG: glycosyltransferase [Sphingobacteriaceae bacterium]
MKLSVITISYNNAVDLNQTIKSVVEQTWREFEYIVIDGGSDDGSVDIIKSYQDRIKFWISEPDGGIYQAMNKGLYHAKGEYLLMLNAGDYLCDTDVLKRVFSAENHSEDLLIGDVYRTASGKVFETSEYRSPLTFDFFRSSSISHQGTFIKREVHDIVGLYDEDLRFSSDWKFFILSICKYNVSYKYLKSFVAVCDCGGLTWNPKYFPAIKKEMQQTLQQYFPAFLIDYTNYDYIRSKAIKNQILGIWPKIKILIKKQVLKEKNYIK